LLGSTILKKEAPCPETFSGSHKTAAFKNANILTKDWSYIRTSEKLLSHRNSSIEREGIPLYFMLSPALFEKEWVIVIRSIFEKMQK
jgi:hypothetical protein